MVCHIEVKPTLHYWDKHQLVIKYNPFCMLLNLIFQYFLEYRQHTHCFSTLGQHRKLFLHIPSKFFLSFCLLLWYSHYKNVCVPHFSKALFIFLHSFQVQNFHLGCVSVCTLLLTFFFFDESLSSYIPLFKHGFLKVFEYIYNSYFEVLVHEVQHMMLLKGNFYFFFPVMGHMFPVSLHIL